MQKGKYILCSGWLLVFSMYSTGTAYPQSPGKQDLIDILKAEAAYTSVLSYSQHYIDSEKETVDYTGTLYLKVDSVSLDGCDLQVNVIVQDRYSGTEETRRAFRQRKTYMAPDFSTSRYSFRLNLATSDKVEASFVSARPSQLGDHTGFVCKEDAFCKLPWVRIKTLKPSIGETIVNDGFLDVNRQVDDVYIPTSSPKSARDSMASFERLVAACQVQTTQSGHSN
jgi:hypothetical protein